MRNGDWYMHFMSPELIIFDCDGVLIDSEAIACRADSACLAEAGIALSAEEIMERYLGISAAAMCADIEQRLGCTLPADFAETLRLRTAATFESGLVPMPGVEALLVALPQRRCVASSSAPERLRHSLSLTGLLRGFEPYVFSATQVARGKPAPDLFLFAAASMQVAGGMRGDRGQRSWRAGRGRRGHACDRLHRRQSLPGGTRGAAGRCGCRRRH
jgi:beta-phosphoglucomutase-like phosphatase (HAD superfamily)